MKIHEGVIVSWLLPQWRQLELEYLLRKVKAQYISLSSESPYQRSHEESIRALPTLPTEPGES